MKPFSNLQQTYSVKHKTVSSDETALDIECTFVGHLSATREKRKDHRKKNSVRVYRVLKKVTNVKSV
jgi:hypothetical protein